MSAGASPTGPANTQPNTPADAPTKARGVQSTFALVELADQSELRAFIGPASFDLLSAEFRARVQAWQRAGDQLRHLDGNRSCVVFRNMHSEVECELAAAKLLRLLEQPLSVVGEEIAARVHVGFVLPSAKPGDVREAMHMAEVALGQARKRRVPFQVYAKDDAAGAPNELQLVHALEAAVERGEFELYYQPKLHAGYNNIIGGEALLRWHRPGGKMVTPQHFIEVAERHPVIEPITWWAIKSAVAQCAQWPESMGVAVNVPPPLLLRDDITLVIEDALSIHAVDPKRLTLEVTEGVMVNDPQRMFAQLRALRALGLRIAIDDFGTGYSSLAYFRELPADELKIDRCFVTHMATAPRDAAIVRAIVALAHNLQLRVVAEGVEDEAIANLLRKERCDVLQGYWIGPPTSAAEFRANYVRG